MNRFHSLAVLAVLAFAVFAFGGIHGWASAILESALALLAVGWFFARERRESVPFGIVAAGALLLAYLAFQLLPLPPSALGFLSETTARRYEEALGSVPKETTGLDLTKGAASTLVSMAAHETRWFPADWRPLNMNPWAGREELFRMVAVALAFWLAATAPFPMTIARGMLGIAVACAAFAAIQFATWNGRYYWLFVSYEAGVREGFDRMVGPFVNPDHLAGFLAIALPAGVGLFAHLASRPLPRDSGSKAWGQRLETVLFHGVGTSLALAALLGSASRTGLVAAPIGCLVGWWAGIRSPSRNRTADESARLRRRPTKERTKDKDKARTLLRRFAPVALATAIIAAGFLYVGAQSRRTLDQRIDRLVSADDFAPRIERWRQTLPMVLDHPWFGVGAGSWADAFSHYRHYPVIGFRETHVHNDYVEWASEVGFIGLALTVLVVVMLGRWARGNGTIPRRIRGGLLGALCAIAFQEVFDFSLRMPANALMVSVVVGLLCNRQWGAPESAPSGERRTPPRLLPAVAMVGVAIVTVAFGVLQAREFLQWRSVFWGGRDLAFPSRNGSTWEQIGWNLHESGKRWGSPTEDCFRRAIDQRPLKGSAYYGLASTFTITAEKIPLLETALRLDPAHAGWRREYARVLELVGRGKEAIAQIEESIALDPRVRAHPYLRAPAKLPEPILAAVDRGYARILARHPRDPLVHREAGFFYYGAKRWADASRSWERAAELSGEWPAVGTLAGSAAALGGDFDRAVTILTSIVERYPEDLRAYRALAIDVFHRQNRFDDARGILEKGLRRVPRSERTELYSTLGVVERARGDEGAAAEAFAAAGRIGRGRVSDHWNAGYSFFKKGDFHRAKAELQAAVRLDPMDPRVHSLLGLILEQLHDVGGALEAFGRASELKPDEASYAENRKRMEQAVADAREQTP